MSATANHCQNCGFTVKAPEDIITIQKLVKKKNFRVAYTKHVQYLLDLYAYSEAIIIKLLFIGFKHY